jgi:hypothetical protein
MHDKGHVRRFLQSPNISKFRASDSIVGYDSQGLIKELNHWGYYVMALREAGHPPSWRWRIVRRGKPMGVRLEGGGVSSYEAARLGAAGRWRTSLSSLSLKVSGPIEFLQILIGRDRYYRLGRLTVSRDVARTELARRLIQLSKEGVRDENSLSLAGLNQLHELTLKGGKIER